MSDAEFGHFWVFDKLKSDILDEILKLGRDSFHNVSFVMSVAGVGWNEKKYLRGGKSICLICDFQLIRFFNWPAFESDQGLLECGEIRCQNFKAIPVVRVVSVDFLVVAEVLSLVQAQAMRQARFGVMSVSRFARAERI